MKLKKNKIYAYVSTENCVSRLAFLPGSVYQGKPVSKHGDLRPWCYGERETSKLAVNDLSAYERATARKVLEQIFGKGELA